LRLAGDDMWEPLDDIIKTEITEKQPVLVCVCVYFYFCVCVCVCVFVWLCVSVCVWCLWVGVFG